MMLLIPQKRRDGKLSWDEAKQNMGEAGYFMFNSTEILFMASLLNFSEILGHLTYSYF